MHILAAESMMNETSLVEHIFDWLIAGIIAAISGVVTAWKTSMKLFRDQVDGRINDMKTTVDHCDTLVSEHSIQIGILESQHDEKIERLKRIEDKLDRAIVQFHNGGHREH